MNVIYYYYFCFSFLLYPFISSSAILPCFFFFFRFFEFLSELLYSLMCCDCLEFCIYECSFVKTGWYIQTDIYTHPCQIFVATSLCSRTHLPSRASKAVTCGNLVNPFVMTTYSVEHAQSCFCNYIFIACLS